MDIYQSTTDHLWALPVIQSWPELKAILTRAASGRPKSWELPLQACEAVGGSPEQAVPAIAAIACAQMSIILLDDMLDEDPRGEYHRAGFAKVANYAAALQSATLEAFCSDNIRARVRLSGLDNLNQMILTTALGQHLDIQNLPDENAYWHVVKTKSAPFFGAALYTGALAGGASHKLAAKLERLGRLYGEMIQIHDDLNDTLSTPANPDWIQGRSPLPILFAKVVDHPDRARFIELCGDISASGALAEAQGILVRCGAVSYCIHQLICRYQTAQALLGSVDLKRRQTMDTLLEKTVASARALFQTIGVDPVAMAPAEGWA